ncbi:MAG: 16S rRNA (adenine(1518)-N(6)/adenine(1519)-N(6))-dimethyltransferase RsmA, partial [Pseudomonadota bacterium]
MPASATTKLDLSPLGETIRRHDLRAKKALGQNFLLDPALLAKIARVPGDLDDAEVYEVGPGPGGLTRALIEAGARVTAVERDPRCLPVLAELAAAAPGGRLTILSDDALAIDEASLFKAPAQIVANLPYNVGTALLTRWLEAETWPPWWAGLTLMFQREVADRIVATPGTRAYGRLSVLAQWRSAPRIVMTLPPGAFVPPPKVESAVVHIVPITAPGGVAMKTLARLTAAAFGQRRKMLRASLKPLPGALAALDHCDIDATRRAETLSVEEFVAVAHAMDDHRD